jgi:chromate reductase
MDNYLIISATNRPENRTLLFAEECKKMLEERRLNALLWSLNTLPTSLLLSDIYNFEKSPLRSIVEKFIHPSSKIIFILPEYNGSYPGILKVFIDAVPTKYFKKKKALLIGTSSGRAGNLRGLDHLTAVLHYVKMEVYSQKLPISSIESLIDQEGKVVDAATLIAMNNHIDEFMSF